MPDRVLRDVPILKIVYLLVPFLFSSRKRREVRPGDEAFRTCEFEFDLEKKEIIKGKITLEMQVGASINAFGQAYDLNFKVTMTRTVEKAEKQK